MFHPHDTWPCSVQDVCPSWPRRTNVAMSAQRRGHSTERGADRSYSWFSSAPLFKLKRSDLQFPFIIFGTLLITIPTVHSHLHINVRIGKWCSRHDSLWDLAWLTPWRQCPNETGEIVAHFKTAFWVLLPGMTKWNKWRLSVSVYDPATFGIRS